jgi:predicted ATPase
MHRFVLTGTPGSGKTAILRQLEIDGLTVVEEAATDIIALGHARGVDEPWTEPGFTDAIAALQRHRQLAADHQPRPVIFDRSPICTHALALHLGHPIGQALTDELNRIRDEQIYERRVFFIKGQDFITPTPARRITLPDARQFEQLHAEVYSSLGYDLITVEPGPLEVRAAQVRAQISHTSKSPGI